jgi:hypothetical protein
MFGPIGALAGAAVGAGTSAVDANARKKEADRNAPPRPKRRKLAGALEEKKEADRQKIASMATLSQAAMEWAQMVR